MLHHSFNTQLFYQRLQTFFYYFRKYAFTSVLQKLFQRLLQLCFKQSITFTTVNKSYRPIAVRPTRVDGPSLRPVLTCNGNRSPANSARVDGPCRKKHCRAMFLLYFFQFLLSTRLMETWRPYTRPVHVNPWPITIFRWFSAALPFIVYNARHSLRKQFDNSRQLWIVSSKLLKLLDGHRWLMQVQVTVRGP